VDLVVRLASVADASGIGDVHMQCWKESYTRLLSPGFFVSRTPERAAERWAKSLAAPSEQAVHVATVAGRVVGFAGSGPSRDEPPARDVELYSIYVLASHHGAGVGQRLLDAAIGSVPASLWVAKDNPRAQAFYRRNGFEPDGAEKVEPSWENLEEIRLVR
jgi:ribosomal protein S18 acetylase RimI-like enzyme